MRSNIVLKLVPPLVPLFFVAGPRVGGTRGGGSRDPHFVPRVPGRRIVMDNIIKKLELLLDILDKMECPPHGVCSKGCNVCKMEYIIKRKCYI